MASAIQRLTNTAKTIGGNITTLLSKRITVPTQTPSNSGLKPHEVQRQLAYYWQQFLKDQPNAFLDMIYRCRYYAVNSSFLTQFLALKNSIWNYDLELVAASGTDEDQKKLDDWLAKEATPPAYEMNDQATGEIIRLETNVTNWERIMKFSNESWNERNTISNVVAFWIDGRDIALTLPPERCLYSDVMGLETMKYLHALHYNQILQLPEDQQERFRNHPAIFVNPNYGEHFRLLKDNPVGDGFATPTMLSIFKPLGQEESMEIGFHELGWTLRKVTIHHKVGHEIKSGSQAGKATHFWTDERDTGIHQAFDNVIGIDNYVGNFDHEIDYPWPDLKRFDDIAWRGVDYRLRRWCGPLGLMLNAKGVAPYLTQLLRAEAEGDRKKMGPFLKMVIKKAFKPPVECDVIWGSTIFSEDRLRAEMIKFGSQTGVVSPQTLTKEIGLNPAKEQKLKLVAAKDPNVQQKNMPIFDTSHGSSPAIDGPLDPNAKAKASGAEAGSKPGTPAGKPHNS